jgi:hypothetical protein
MLRAKVVVFVGIVLLLAQVPCIAACAGQLCDGLASASMPPCHRHRNHSEDRGSACPYQMTAGPVMSQQATDAKADPAVCPMPDGLVRWSSPRHALDTSPPGLPGFATAVLRI